MHAAITPYHVRVGTGIRKCSRRGTHLTHTSARTHLTLTLSHPLAIHSPFPLTAITSSVIASQLMSMFQCDTALLSQLAEVGWRLLSFNFPLTPAATDVEHGRMTKQMRCARGSLSYSLLSSDLTGNRATLVTKSAMECSAAQRHCVETATM